MSAPAALYSVDDIAQNDLPRLVADVVHLLNPHQLILRFHRFGHFLLICHLTDESLLHIHGSLFDIVKVLSQRTVRQEIVVQDSVMITEEPPTHLCINAEKIDYEIPKHFGNEKSAHFSNEVNASSVEYSVFSPLCYYNPRQKAL